ncbi:DNA-directed RNA polymerase I polypeptide [Usnea florida]
MAAIGSLVFCTDCGNLLDGSSGDENAILKCDVCGNENRDTSISAITTRSKPAAFPSALRSKRSAVQTLTEEDVQKDAVIRQTCPECGNKEMRYYTQQLRSADEGSTVFYSCDCGHR